MNTTNDAGERWHYEPATSRATIRDENGLFVADAILEDAPLIAEAPAMRSALVDCINAWDGKSSDVMEAAIDAARALLARIDGEG